MTSVKTLSQYREERQATEPSQTVSHPIKEFEQSLKVLSVKDDSLKKEETTAYEHALLQT